MNEILFAISFIILLTIFLKRHRIVHYVLQNYGLRMGSEVIVAILSVFFVALVLAGMLLDNTKEKYSQISEDFEKIKPKEDTRPHRYFDVNTYDK